MGATISKQALFEKIGYVPHSAGQRAYHASQARFRIPVCGRRYGKSTMAGTDRLADMFVPNRQGWIVGPTYDLGEKEFRVMWDALIVGLRMGSDKRVKKSYNKRQGDMYIEMPWGARVEVRSASQPERLVGEKLHWAIMSEAAKHSKETWERFIRPSLADYRGGADFPTTPEGYNWLYDLWMLGFDPSFANYDCFQFPSWENPVVFPGGRHDQEIVEIERTTTEDWFKQEIGADFSAFVGKIFAEFNENTHVRSHNYNPLWRNYIAFDWGYVNPLAAIEFQIDPQDNIYVWREHYKSYTMIREHAELLKRRPQPEGYRIELMFGDAADPEAATTMAVEMGVQCVADTRAKENWREGVDMVKMFLKTVQTGNDIDEFGTPEMVPKFFVDPSCTNLIREFNGYKAHENSSSNLREASTTSAAVKQDDHCLDALRYGLVHIYKLGATYGLRDVLVSSGAPSELSLDGNTFFREQILLNMELEF